MNISKAFCALATTDDPLNEMHSVVTLDITKLSYSTLLSQQTEYTAMNLLNGDGNLIQLQWFNL